MGQVHCRRSVDGDREAAGGPGRPAQRERERFGRAKSQLDRRRFAFGKRGLHVELNAGGVPFRDRRGIQVHPQPIAGLVVDAEPVQRMALHSRAHAAGEAARHVLVFAPDRAADRHHVAGGAVGGIHRSEDVVEQRPLVEFGVPHVGLEREQPARQLEHVVDVARLGRAAVDDVAQPIGLAEVLILPVTAGREGVVTDDAIPEERRGGSIVAIAGVGVTHGRSQELRHLGVAVQTGEPILAAGERVDDRAVVELVRERQPAPIARIGVEVGEHLVHAAELGVEHLLKLRAVETRENPPGPSRELDLDVERRAVVGIAVCIAQPGKGLVQRVPRRPEAVQIEGR